MPEVQLSLCLCPGNVENMELLLEVSLVLDLIIIDTDAINLHKM